MRIVAGALRGRALVAPKGHSTRPTSDRVRQALFDVLAHAAWSPGLNGVRAIDLFAGSGALGIEALSRGAAACLFVDEDPAAIEVIVGNARTLGIEERTTTRRGDATRLAPATADPFALAFLDPPYGRGLAEKALAALVAGGWLTPGAIVVVESGAGEGGPDIPGLEMLDTRVWGAARVSFLRWT
jgi:16S rRNA (guanine966-N2)-methyltransferase